MSREIHLTHGKVALVDDEDYERLSPYKWFAQNVKGTDLWHAKRIEKAGDGSVLNIYMHRVVLDAGSGEEIDHADNDGLNNTRSNLRFCSRSQNCANMRRGLPHLASSGYRGVYLEKGKTGPMRYRASASLNGKKVSFGYYASAIAAAHARDKGASQLYGEFAVLNFPRAPK